MVSPAVELKVSDPKIYPEIMYEGRNKYHVYKSIYPDGKKERLPIEPSQQIRDYSYEFSWAGLGSGPSQLALALLLDATLDPDTAWDYHTEFKQVVVSSWGEKWVLFRHSILNWLKNIQALELEKRQGEN